MALGATNCSETQTAESRRTKTAPDVLCVADRHTEAFDQQRLAVDVVCAGDSITGWNNFGPAAYWPYPIYPQFLQEMCQPLGLRLANGGIAGEISPNGIGHVQDYLGLFPAARCFIKRGSPVLTVMTFRFPMLAEWSAQGQDLAVSVVLELVLAGGSGKGKYESLHCPFPECVPRPDSLLRFQCPPRTAS
jgi:hypothetical protein